METTSELDDQSKNTENTNQGKIKTDQGELSTPPHTTNTNADSQATKIIDSGSSHDSQGYHTSDQDGGSDKVHSSEDEEEKQYDRPWYKFWGSSDSPISTAHTPIRHIMTVIDVLYMSKRLRGENLRFFHSIANLFPQIMALLIDNISLQACYREKFSSK